MASFCSLGFFMAAVSSLTCFLDLFFCTDTAGFEFPLMFAEYCIRESSISLRAPQSSSPGVSAAVFCNVEKTTFV